MTGMVDLPDLVLLQVELVQLGHVGGQEDILEVVQVPFRVDDLGEGVGQQKLLQAVKVGEEPPMVVLPANLDVVVVQHQPLDAAHLVEGLARDLGDVVVGEVDDLQVLVVVPHPENVPVQELDAVAVEEEHLGAVGQQLQHAGVREPGVGAVHDKDLLLRPPLGIVLSAASALLAEGNRTPRVVYDTAVLSGADSGHHQGHRCREDRP